MAPPGARQRRSKEKAEKAPAPAEPASAPPPPERASARTTARNLAAITLVVGLPYALYCAYVYVHLESGWLRPAVGVRDARQLLIVGSQSAGTTQMAAALSKLGLEVAHEASDTTSQFARDGSVSWFHGIRFFEGEAPARSLDLLCARSYRNMGFHPAAFRRARCSIRVEWDACWARECRAVVRESWGCASRGDCETPFAKALLQNRHPLRTMESLIVKFCRSETAPASPALVLFARALWPAAAEWDDDACVPVVAAYVTRYYESMLEAVAAGRIDGMYRLEAVDTCAVAALGGFGAALYAPAREAFERACAGPGATGADLGGDNVRNKRNRGLVRLALANLSAIDASLARRVVALGRRMGYDPIV